MHCATEYPVGDCVVGTAPVLRRYDTNSMLRDVQYMRVRSNSGQHMHLLRLQVKDIYFLAVIVYNPAEVHSSGHTRPELRRRVGPRLW